MSSDFIPLRSSTPARRKVPQIPATHATNTTIASNATTSSAGTLPLSALTPSNIALIDQIIERTPVSATSFDSVFNVYKQVLPENDIDPGDDVVYYGFLLKLGVIRGKNWHERWEAVKDSLRDRSHISWPSTREDEDEDDGASFISKKSNPRPLDTPRPVSRNPLLRRATAASAISYMSTPGASTSKTPLPKRLPAPVARYMTPSTPAYVQNPFSGKTLIPAPQFPSPSEDSELMDAAHTQLPDDSDGEDEVFNYPIPTRPPSYHTNAPSPSIPLRKLPVHTPAPRATPPPPPASLTTLRPWLRPKSEQHVHPRIEPEERGVNGHDFWQVAEMERDADDFRAERLLKSSLLLWYGTLIHKRDRLHQVAQAYDNMVARKFLLEWQDARNKRAILYKRVEFVDDIRRLRFALRTWQSRIEEKKRRELREGVRRRFSLIRKSTDTRVLRGALQRWNLQTKLGHLQRRRDTRLAHSILGTWHSRLQDIKQMEAVAPHFRARWVEFMQVRVIDVWYERLSLKLHENAVSEMVTRRVKEKAWVVWRRTTKLQRLAHDLHSNHVLRQAATKWIQRHQRIKTMERKATNHVRRKDDTLLRAILRVWTARTHGELLERFKRTRLAQNIVNTWISKHNHIQEMQATAVTLAASREAIMMSSTLRHWQSRMISQSEALGAAVVHHDRMVLYRALKAWREERARQLKMIKQARIARRFTLKRRMFRVWLNKVEERKLEQKEQEWKTRTLQKVFVEWHEATRRSRILQSTARYVQERQEHRIQREGLQLWMGRIINVNEKELALKEKVDQRLKEDVLDKWQVAYSRHLDRVSLMESVRSIKVEKILRQTFNWWYEVTQINLDRRDRLEALEEEWRLRQLRKITEAWYHKRRVKQLFDKAIEVHKADRKLVYGIFFYYWRSKTISIPAKQFDLARLQKKMLRRWVEALPYARGQSKAKAFDKEHVQRHCFQRWHAAFKVKQRLKSIALATKLGLTSANIPSSRGLLVQRPFSSRITPPTPNNLSSRPRGLPAFTPRAPAPDPPLTRQRSLSPTRPVVKPLPAIRPSPASLRTPIGLSLRPRRVGLFGSSARQKANSVAPTEDEDDPLPRRGSAPTGLLRTRRGSSASSILKTPSPIANGAGAGGSEGAGPSRRDRLSVELRKAVQRGAFGPR